MGGYYSALNRLRHEGYQAELLLVDSRELSFELDWAMATSSVGSTGVGYRLEVVKDGRIGIANSNVFNNELAERAMRMAAVSERDKSRGLPSGDSAGRSSVNLKFNLADGVDKIKQIFLELTDTPKWNLTGAQVSAGNYRKRVISTEGTDIEEWRSSIALGMAVSLRSRMGGPLPDVGEEISSTALNISVGDIKDSVARKKEALKTVVKNDKRYDEVVFTSLASVQLFGSLLADAFWGENLYRQRTPLGKGMEIGNPDISIIDDPAVRNSTYSRTFDAAGQRKSPITLLGGGEVENFLYDEYWARKASAKNTASADGVSNLVIKAREERDVTQDALVVDYLQGVHESDTCTGRFSVSADVAWRNMNGCTQGVKDVIIAGDLLSLLRGIESTSIKKRIDEHVVVGDLRVKGLSVG